MNVFAVERFWWPRPKTSEGVGVVAATRERLNEFEFVACVEPPRGFWFLIGLFVAGEISRDRLVWLCRFAEGRQVRRQALVAK